MPPDRVFALLGNETRMEILRATWERTRTVGLDGREPVSFSELQAAVGADDSGNFNYHLDQLVGRFIGRVDDGYVIRQAGTHVVRAMLAGTVTEDPTFGPMEVDESCYRCGGPVVAAYEDERIDARCRECAGAITLPNYSEGTLAVLSLPPAGVRTRTPAAAMRAAFVNYFGGVSALCAGVCSVCGSDTRIEVHACPDHEVPDGGLCPTCENEPAVVAEAVCETCAFYRVLIPAFGAVGHPTVSSAFAAAGLDPVAPAYPEFAEAMSWPVDAETNPLRVEYDLPTGTTVVVDGTMSVVETR